MVSPFSLSMHSLALLFFVVDRAPGFTLVPFLFVDVPLFTFFSLMTWFFMVVEPFFSNSFPLLPVVSISMIAMIPLLSL